jgi:mercuric ion transport protein
MSIARVFDKTGSFGALASAWACAGCFPALGSLGAALGMGFLSQYEGFLFRKLLPAFAFIALLANRFVGYKHRSHLRGALSVFGAIVVLAALFPLWNYDWSIHFFYFGLALMLAVSVFDFFRPIKAAQYKA